MCSSKVVLEIGFSTLIKLLLEKKPLQYNGYAIEGILLNP